MKFDNLIHYGLSLYPVSFDLYFALLPLTVFIALRNSMRESI